MREYSRLSGKYVQDDVSPTFVTICPLEKYQMLISQLSEDLCAITDSESLHGMKMEFEPVMQLCDL